MDIAVWILVGAIIGWISFSMIGLNEGRGMVISITIGAVGGLLGGKLIAPFFSAPAAAPGDFGGSAIVFAAAVAAACLFAGHLVHQHWEV
jgi:uncharacterized membrane protein YeaQ/YmgE (transglycosylase-associated protein family)